MSLEPSPAPSGNPAAGQAIPPPMVCQPPMLHNAGQMIREDERTMAMLCHLLGIFTGFLGPLIVWLVKKDNSPYINHHGREALNFQLTLLLLMLCLGSATFILMFVFVGILLVPVIFVVQILAIVAEIMAAVAAQKGEWHRYPFSLRLV